QPLEGCRCNKWISAQFSEDTVSLCQHPPAQQALICWHHLQTERALETHCTLSATPPTRNSTAGKEPYGKNLILYSVQ
uniref:Uncharacterized protein n=1 Tax=Chrysemys picta bellii TaxID=8478 RepID=A0A8C3IYL6_CHRPI